MGTYLRKQWEENFVNHLSDAEKKGIYICNDGGYSGYLWHVFSYQKRKCYMGEEAVQAFNNKSKSACYIFYQHSDDALILDDAGQIKSSDLMDGIDIYVIDKEFSWTFIKTHETEYCGPYFSHK